MAQNPYDGGAATVAQDTRLPDDYAHVQATPEAFGGAIAHGMQEAGQGAVKASQFYGQVAADEATNQLFDRWNKRMYGDPTKQVTQPDGTTAQDTGYMGLKGRAALDARPGLEASMEADIAEIRKNLPTPEMQLAFDRDSRRYRLALQQHVGQHAEGQFSVWGSEVNKAAGRTALAAISNTAYDEEAFQHGKADMISARVKDAQLQGGGNDLVNAAVQSGTQEAWKARLEAISVKDPAMAAKMADEHQKELGHFYEPLAQQFRGRASQSVGIGAANDAIAKARSGAVAPPSSTTSASSSAIHSAIIKQESSGNPNIKPSIDGALGIGQIMPGTFKQYAKPGENINNPADNFAVSRRIVDTLSAKYNGDPARVAVAYFSGEGNVAPAGSPTPWKVDRADGNGKRTSSYVSDILKKLGRPGVQDAQPQYSQPNAQADAQPNATGTANPSLPEVDSAPPMVSSPPLAPQVQQAPAAPTPEQLKAAAYQAIHDNQDLSHEEKEHAFHEINRQIAEQQIMDQANEKAKKDANDKAANGYVTRILNGESSGLIKQIANDPALQWQTKDHLVEAVKRYSGNDAEAATHAYGPGFWGAYKAVTAAPGDPSRISDPMQLLKRAGPDGDLTLAGVQKLHQTMIESQKSVNDAAVHTTKVGLLNYARSKLTFDQETMAPGFALKDQKGVQIFEGQFIPKFEAAFDQWTKDGKNPWDFLTQKNIDPMVEGLRPKAQMAMDRLAASGEAAPANQAGQEEQVPPPPEGVGSNLWKKAISERPLRADGNKVPAAIWAKAITMLRSDPSPQVKKEFDQYFARSGVTANQILEKLDDEQSTGSGLVNWFLSGETD
jgi:Transglycosylase SLT domain